MITADQLAIEILSLTEEMVTCATQGELERFNTVREQRDSLVARLENESLQVEDINKTGDRLKQARNLNAALANNLVGEQQKLLDQKTALTKAIKMQKAYQQVKP